MAAGTWHFLCKGLIDNKLAFVQVKISCETGGKPEPVPMVAYFIYINMHHQS